MSQDEVQKFICEQLTKINKKQDKGEQTLSELKTAIEDSTATSKEALQIAKQLSTENKVLRTELDQVKLRNAQLNSDMVKMQDRIISLESHSRRDNLIFQGVDESTPEDVYKKILSIFTDKLKLENAENIRIVRVHRLGKKRENTSRPRPIIVKFHWYGDRMNVVKARRNLKGSRIYINEDFPKEIQERRKILRPIMMRAKTAKKEAFLNVDTLIIDGKPYTVRNLNTLPAGLSPSEVATPTIGDTIVAFYGNQSPLSNFHPAKFNVQGVDYDDSEQFYQKKKSDFAVDAEAGARIMRATSALECYKIGLELNKKIDIQTWHSGPAIQAMKEGLNAKFGQNAQHKKFLLSTRGKTLVEASLKDLLWGCGIALRDHEKMLDIDNWPGKNLLGKLLEEVRDDLVKA